MTLILSYNSIPIDTQARLSIMAGANTPSLQAQQTHHIASGDTIVRQLGVIGHLIAFLVYFIACFTSHWTQLNISYRVLYYSVGVVNALLPHQGLAVYLEIAILILHSSSNYSILLTSCVPVLVYCL